MEYFSLEEKGIWIGMVVCESIYRCVCVYFFYLFQVNIKVKGKQVRSETVRVLESVPLFDRFQLSNIK